MESRIRQLEGGEITKISATAKQSAKFDKYESKSEVLEYKAAADVTLKRKAEDDDKEKPDVKKIKVEDVEAEGSKKKKKKKDKQKEEEEEVEAKAAVAVSPKKKKKKKDKENVEAADSSLDTSAMDTIPVTRVSASSAAAPPTSSLCLRQQRAPYVKFMPEATARPRPLRQVYA